MKNEVLMKSSHKLKNERSKYIQAIEQPLISIDLKFFTNQIKSKYLKSILQSRSSLLPSYCRSGQHHDACRNQFDFILYIPTVCFTSNYTKENVAISLWNMVDQFRKKIHIRKLFKFFIFKFHRAGLIILSSTSILSFL